MPTNRSSRRAILVRSPAGLVTRLVPLALWVLMPGCGPATTYPTAHLAGAVTISGQPVGEGKIVFLPLEAAHGPSVGSNIINGRYDCRTAPRGRLLVQVYAVRPTGKKLQVMGSKIPELINIVPQEHRDGIEVPVDGDNLRFDFAL